MRKHGEAAVAAQGDGLATRKGELGPEGVR